MAIGILTITGIIIAFTSLPFWGIYWLGTSKSGMVAKPDVIIMLGGGGMPSESNLIRSWYIQKAALHFPEASVLVAMPEETSGSQNTPEQIKTELELRGIHSERIIFENKGRNTREQALLCSHIIQLDKNLLLITSPEHTRRAVLCFQKVGYTKVNALPAFENAAGSDLRFNDSDLGGRNIPAPQVGNHVSVRYQVWNHLKYEISFIREMAAIGYYKIKGWI